MAKHLRMRGAEFYIDTLIVHRPVHAKQLAKNAGANLVKHQKIID